MTSKKELIAISIKETVTIVFVGFTAAMLISAAKKIVRLKRELRELKKS